MSKVSVTATKEFTWDCAHLLAGHEGLCKNLHGHTYKLLVTVKRLFEDTIEEGPSKGMVVDFKDLKNYVVDNIVSPLDHSTIIDMSNEDAFEAGLYHLLNNHDKKIFRVWYRPTAENMARDFFFILNNSLETAGANYRVVYLRLYETPTSYAEIIKQEDN